MPDHVHLVAMGTSERSDVLRGLEDFKQLTGYWLKPRIPLFRWQKGFHDRILRANELGPAVRYVLDNPVRKQIVREWRDYRFIGAIGLDLETFLTDLVEL
jgi:REP element-mobilizing transposase RayT